MRLGRVTSKGAKAKEYSGFVLDKEQKNQYIIDVAHNLKITFFLPIFQSQIKLILRYMPSWMCLF